MRPQARAARPAARQRGLGGDGGHGRDHGPELAPGPGEDPDGDARATSDYWRIWYYVLEMCGLAVQLVSPSQARHLPGRPKTDKLDAMWLARLTEWGMLRPCFVPPALVRVLRDYTRARADLIRERTRCWQRLEKLLEGAQVKISSVASKLTTLSAQDMIRALIAGERDPRTLAALARGRMKSKTGALEQALAGMFDAHHGELAQLELDQIAFLDTRIAQLGDRSSRPSRTSPKPREWTRTARPARRPGPDRMPRCCPRRSAWRRSRA